MKHETLALLVALNLLAAPVWVSAQPAQRHPRIGVLFAGSADDGSTGVEAFRHGLREVGYVEGQNITVDGRFLAGRMDQLGALAAELVALKPDILVCPFRPGVRGLKQATATIPIVMAGAGDPIGSGFIASLARPGGTITGLTSMSPELEGKRPEILKDAVPRVSRRASVWDAGSWGPYKEGEFDVAARTLGLRVLQVEVRSPDGLDAALGAAVKQQAGALFTDNSPLSYTHRALVAALAIQHRLPWIAQDRDYPEAGALMSYGTDWTDLIRRSASYVDRILKGARPADLPVEQPTRFELVVNLKTAKALGLTIPQSVLFRADHVIQ